MGILKKKIKRKKTINYSLSLEIYGKFLYSYILFLYIPRITETLPKGPSRVQGAGVVCGWVELGGIVGRDI